MTPDPMARAMHRHHRRYAAMLPGEPKATPGTRRRALGAIGRAAMVLAIAALSACAALGLRQPIGVRLVDIEPLPSEGMELRVAVKLRLQNPNDAAIDFDGVSLALDLRGASFATGVSGVGGSIPRLGETIVTVPVSVSALAAARQVLVLASDRQPHVDYALHGRLAGVGMGGMAFESKGDIQLPVDLLQ